MSDDASCAFLELLYRPRRERTNLGSREIVTPCDEVVRVVSRDFEGLEPHQCAAVEPRLAQHGGDERNARAALEPG